MTPERKDALWKADRALDRPYADPDDDLAVVSRQLLRSAEEIDKLRAELDNYKWAHDAWQELARAWFGKEANVTEYGDSLQARLLVVPMITKERIAELEAVKADLKQQAYSADLWMIAATRAESERDRYKAALETLVLDAYARAALRPEGTTK